jgi:MFS family permease
LLAAIATWLFGVTQDVSVFVMSRALEGLATAAGVPALLAHLTDATAVDHRLRARAMSYFELSLLAGLALGGVVGGQLWAFLHTGAFTALALLYAGAAVLLFVGSAGSVGHRKSDVWQGLMRALGTPQLLRLAPVWLCMNAIVGLWLGPTLYFLLTNRSVDTQMLSGLFAGSPSGLGWLLFVYALVFATGVLAWSRVLPRVDLRRALRVSLLAMLAVALGLMLLNHMDGQPIQLRWTLTAVIAVLIMLESGFTPAALSLLAATVGPRGGRGATMGIYSFLLSVGALIGSVLAGVTGRWLAIDGLIYATLGLAMVALSLLSRLAPERPLTSEARA